MLSTLRRLIYSKIGAVFAFFIFGIFALAMVGGDVSSLRTEGLAALTGGGGNDVVRVGGTRVSTDDFAKRVAAELDGYRQQQPTADMAGFIAAGGFDAALKRLTASLALDQFGRDQGMVISRKAEDGQIASIPGLQGANGEFDEGMFRQLLLRQKITEQTVRTDLSRDMMANALTAPLLRVQAVPQQLALPYANMLLEKREGVIAFIPSRAMPAGAAATDAELQAFYARNVARYTVSERRAIRYALVSPASVRAQATPTDVEIAAAYAADRTTYAPTEKRTITQVVVLDRAAADRLAAAVKGGTPLVAAATAAGLATSTKTALTKAALAGQTSPALADAVFAASKNGIVGPVRAPLGFTVARVEQVEQVAGRTLAQARDEIAGKLTTQKTIDALNNLQTGIDDLLGANDTFDEIVRDKKLASQLSAPLLPNGLDPDQQGTPDPVLAPLLAAAFGMQEGDEPQMVPMGTEGSFALVGLARIVPAAPRPLAQLRETVVRDLTIDRARLAARKVAAAMLARVNGGATMQQAWAETKLAAAPPRPLVATREAIDRAQGPSRAPLALMFAMPRGAARLLEAPGGAGWAVVKLERTEPGDASRDPTRVAAIRQAFGGLLGREYAEQFAKAAEKAVGVKTNPQAVQRVRAQLLNQGGSAGS